MKYAIALLILLTSMVPASAEAAQIDDREVYQHIVERVHEGQGYYPAAAAELRIHDYPLKPALAFRFPTLAWIEGLLPNSLSRFALLLCLGAGALLLWARSLSDVSKSERIALCLAALTGLSNIGAVGSLYLHEVWSIVFQLACLALIRRSAAGASIMAFLALVTRETALPFVAAVCVVTWFHGNRRTAIATALAICAAAILWVFHAAAVAQVVVPSDPTSPGWLSFSGLSLVAPALRWNLVLAHLPTWLVVGALPFLFAAFLVQRRPELIIAGIVSFSFTIALFVLGRPDNDYWGVMFAPYLLMGVASSLGKRADFSRKSQEPIGSK